MARPLPAAHSGRSRGSPRAKDNWPDRRRGHIGLPVTSAGLTLGTLASFPACASVRVRLSPGRSPQHPGPLGLTFPRSSIRVALTALGFWIRGVCLRDHHRLPGRSFCRPPRSRRTGRSATSREVSRSRPFGVLRPRRSVSEATGLRTIPLRRSFDFHAADALVGIAVFELALAVFGASRLRCLR
jgi:hypothetical protein